MPLSAYWVQVLDTHCQNLAIIAHRKQAIISFIWQDDNCFERVRFRASRAHEVTVSTLTRAQEAIARLTKPH